MAMLGDEGGAYEMPFFYAIWDSTSDSKFGNSPAMTCMADIERLNVLMKAQREQAGMAVAPPLVTEDRNILGDINLKKRGVTVVRNMDKLRELITGARFDVGDNEIERLVRSVERSFLMDSLQLKESPAMTATEVQARYDLMMRSISHTLGSLQSNFLDKVIERTVNILYRADRLRDMPDVVRDSASEFDILYTGPMSRAQKQDDVMATNNWLQAIIPVMAELQIQTGSYPEVLDVPDFDMIARDLADLSGVPAKYLKDADEIKKDREERDAEQKEMRAAAAAEQEGNSMKAMGEGAQAMTGGMQSVG